MKINMPVTDVEYVLVEQDSVVSKTGLRGIITYINEDFLRISGFTQNELIGSSHNIVRHPDLPPEAFEDMWQSLKAGRPWTGLVKNGNFQWVLANAAPTRENDQLTGYLPVRSKPSHEQIQTASAAYKLFRQGKAGSLKIQDGKVVKLTLLGKLNLFKNLNPKTRMAFVLALLSILPLFIGGMALLGMDKGNEGLHAVYENRTGPMSQIASIQKLLLTKRLLITASLSNPAPELIQETMAAAEQNIADIDKPQAITQMDDVTQQNAALVEHTDNKHGAHIAPP
jgi:methyl-accepting chemotaxis protein